MDLSSILEMMLTCQDYYKMINSDNFWRGMVERDYGDWNEDDFPKEVKDAKDIYKTITMIRELYKDMENLCIRRPNKAALVLFSNTNPRHGDAVSVPINISRYKYGIQFYNKDLSMISTFPPLDCFWPTKPVDYYFGIKFTIPVELNIKTIKYIDSNKFTDTRDPKTIWKCKTYRLLDIIRNCIQQTNNLFVEFLLDDGFITMINMAPNEFL